MGFSAKRSSLFCQLQSLIQMACPITLRVLQGFFGVTYETNQAGLTCEYLGGGLNGYSVNPLQM